MMIVMLYQLLQSVLPVALAEATHNNHGEVQCEASNF